jgi:hypothetical protein
MLHLIATTNVIRGLLILSTLMMESICFSEISVLTGATRQVFMAVTMNSAVLWDVTPCDLLSYFYFVPSSLIVSALMIKVIRSCETSHSVTSKKTAFPLSLLRDVHLYLYALQRFVVFLVVVITAEFIVFVSG